MRHYIAVMDSRGDTRTEFESADPASLAEARRVFDSIKEKGGAVFRTQPGGEGGGQMHEFDPNTDMLGVPRIEGG